MIRSCTCSNCGSSNIGLEVEGEIYSPDEDGELISCEDINISETFDEDHNPADVVGQCYDCEDEQNLNVVFADDSVMNDVHGFEVFNKLKGLN